MSAPIFTVLKVIRLPDPEVVENLVFCPCPFFLNSRPLIPEFALEVKIISDVGT